ncbi:MAG: FG-GAP repeat protein [Saprospiraceae bacterium]
MKCYICLVLLLFSPVLNILITAQNVGIGTITPTEKLDVDGNVKADTLKPNAFKFLPNAGAGKILTSDGIGNASWENMMLPPPPNNYNGNVGYGVWGDCATNGNISEYNPVVDEEGAGQDISIGDHFGYTTAISGNFAIIGSYGDDAGAGINQGSVSFYQFDGNTWIFVQKVIDEDGEAWAFFGQSISIAGNFAIVGAPQDNGNAGDGQGSSSIYQYNGSTWQLMQKITDADGAAHDNFGSSVSLSGNYAIIGSPDDSGPAGPGQGSVNIYQFDGNAWVLMEKILDANGASGDFFGHSVSISGNLFVAGSYFDDDVSGQNQGSASIYQFDGSNWIFVQKLLDVTGVANDYFGDVVSISGNYVLVGIPNDDVFGVVNQGSVCIYQYNGSNWIQTQRLYDVNGSMDDYFGSSVSVSDHFAIVGSAYDNIGTQADQGSADIYIRLGTNWERLQYVIDPRGNSNDHLGQDVAIDALTKRFLIGSHGYTSDKGKVIFGKIN